MSANPTRAGHLEVRGVELAYAWHGPTEGTPFVLVHGFTGSSDDWREHLPELGTLGPTVALDLRGHGDSTNLGDEAAYTLDHLVQDLAAALTELGIERCDLLGHSMGGMVALRFALEQPDRLRSLVLMDTSDSAMRLASPGEFDKLVQFVKARGVDALLHVMRRRSTEDRPAAVLAYAARVGSEAAWSRIEAKLRAMDPAAYVGFARALSQQVSVRDRLGEITCPALVMVGDQDTDFLEPTESMARGIPNAQKVVIADAAHSPQLENPEAWSKAIREHLERARA